MRFTRLAAPVTLAVTLLTATSGAEALEKVYRIGTLSPSPPGGTTRAFDEFKHSLQERGWVEGQNVVFERRYAAGQFDRLPALAEELVKLRVDVILATSTPAVLAAKHATSTIPIVIPVSGDTVALGLVRSLARPGGNITGINAQIVDLGPKQLQLPKETIPGASRVGALHDPSYTQSVVEMRQMLEASAARLLRLSVYPTESRTASDLDAAFASLRSKRTDALIVTASPTMLTNRGRIIELAASYRLPAMYGLKEFAAAGGLIAYGASLPHMYRRAALYVDKILGGANPGNLPMEQPTKFELVINLKTAQALGLTIPPSVLARADEVIQ